MDNRYIPHRTKIYKIAADIKRILFYHDEYRMDHHSLMWILDIVSRDDAAPNNNHIPWGEAITAINSVKAVYDKIGVRGTYLQQQLKQGITCSLLDLDHNNKVCNKKLLKALLPHINRTARDNWITKCAAFKVQFDNDEINILCARYENITTKSYVPICSRLQSNYPCIFYLYYHLQ